ncbi:5e63f2d9-bd87-4b2c-93ce-55ed5c6272c5 [Thermothielavioides terrestris]|uniref:5e63f2d9-bd87-4b2c-93ce-55ed5c6272c5 n=1 Tax=Thermothielavioides terrestris TaxID=2587410 RepID=A0A446BKU0_9PEZI|nr:5e63f2d9-bd87-4b2c-93ce-55ed5c6272c5 [Thermothielavioides terrestris]
MAVTTVLTDLAHSLGELLSSVFGTAYALVHSFVADLFGLLAGFFALANDLVRDVVDLVGGVGRFVAGNVVVLGVIAAAGYYAYARFVQQPQQQQPQQQQGREPVGASGAGAGKKKAN